MVSKKPDMVGGPAAKRAQRLASLVDSGQLAAAVDAARGLSQAGRAPQTIRIRRGFYRNEVAGEVLDERKPLPVEQRPPAGQMILPRGVALQLHLAMLFAAHCQAAPGKRWNPVLPIVPGGEDAKPRSLMGLLAVDAHSIGGAGVQAGSKWANKRRQIAAGLGKLHELNLLDLPHAGQRSPYRAMELLRESGGSSDAAPLPYQVPVAGTPGLELPVGFFTNGWLHLLTTSEIIAYLMWLDVNANPSNDEPFITGHERAGHFGLGREVYETHRQLDAFGLVAVERPEGRHDDGRFDFEHSTESGSALCHRVTVEPLGLQRDAAHVVADVLARVNAVHDWSRPMELRSATSNRAA